MSIQKLTMIVLKAVALGMGAGVVVLSCLKQLDVNAAVPMLGVGLVCLAIAQLSAKDQ